jgi:hypothetical protein
MSRTHGEPKKSRWPDYCRGEGDTIADARLDLD